MADHRVHNGLSTIHRALCFGRKACCALWFVLLCFSGDKQCYAQSSYDINDPRNPDCPCHKAQKIADEEYAQLIRRKEEQGENDSEQQIRHIQKKEKEIGTDRSVDLRSPGHGVWKRKTKKTWVRWKKYVHRKKRSGVKKVKTDYSVCVKW